MSRRGRAEKILLEDFVREEVFAQPANTYSSIVRGLIEAALRDLEGRLAIEEDPKREKKRKKRKPLERLFTEYSKEITLVLHNAQAPCWAERLKEAEAWVKKVYSAARKVFDLAFLLELKTDSRLAVHLRNPYMPLEIGLAWHPFLDLPYIPATTIKGALRAYFTEKRVTLGGVDASQLFGTQSHSGALVIFDAVPVGTEREGGRVVEADIVNPHYPEVEGRVYETAVRPRPLVFPTVAPGTRFELVVAVSGSGVPPTALPSLASELPQKLQEALQWGLGAKVSVGYGRVSVKLLDSWRRGV